MEEEGFQSPEMLSKRIAKRYFVTSMASDNHQGKVQTVDLGMSTDPGPQQTFSMFFYTNFYIYEYYINYNKKIEQYIIIIFALFSTNLVRTAKELLSAKAWTSSLGKRFQKKFFPFEWVSPTFWGLQKQFWRKLSFNIGEQNYYTAIVSSSESPAYLANVYTRKHASDGYRMLPSVDFTL